MKKNSTTSPVRAGRGLEETSCRQFKGGKWRDFVDVVSPEIPLTLTWPGREPTQLWAWPGEPVGAGLDDLVLGHALLDLSSGTHVPVIISRGEDFFEMSPTHHPVPTPAPLDPSSLTAQDIIGGMERFIAAEGRWGETGCFHRAAAYDPCTATFIRQVEDIGRHNCIDRLTGWTVRKGVSPASLVLFVSARATASLVTKIIRAGFAAVISRSAVTSGGLALARNAELTLAGFARPGRFTVFTDQRGIIADPGMQPQGTP